MSNPPDFFGTRPPRPSTPRPRRAREPRTRRFSFPWRAVGHVVALLAAVAGYVVAVVYGTPWLSGTGDRRILALAAAATLGAVTVAHATGDSVSARTRRVLTRTLVALAVLFAWGAVTSTVVGGTALLATSERAHAVEQARRIDADLTFVENLAVLLAADGPAARAAYARYQDAAVELSRREKHWVGVVEKRPSDELAPASQLTRDTFFYAVEAVKAKIAAVNDGSVETAAKAGANAQQMLATAARARQALAEAAAAAPLSLTGSDLDEVSR